MPRWAKLSEAIAEDLTIGEMLSKPADARAALLFLMSLPRADLYGILPGNPRLFKARVCPVSYITEGTVEKALTLLVENGMLKSFTDEGQTYLLIANYHKYQVVRWNNWVGPPTVRLPDDWEPPAGLVVFVKKLSPEKVCPYMAQIPALASFLPTTTVDYCSLPTTTVLDVDVDVDAVTDVDTETTKAKACADSGAAPEKKLTPQQKVIQLAWTAFGFDGKPSVEASKKAPGYSELTKLVQEHGIPKVKEWAAVIKRQPPELPEGAERWKWFKEQFRRGMSRDFDWQPKQGKSGKRIPLRKETDYGEPGPIDL